MNMNIKAILFVFIPLVFLYCSNVLEVNDRNWSYENGKLKISFILKNKGNNEIQSKVKITAHRISTIGKGAIVNDIIVEKTINVRIHSNEQMKISDSIDIPLKIRPTLVIFTLLK